MRGLSITVATLVLLAAAAVAYASYAAPAVAENRAAFAYLRTDLFRYSAKWWSYLVPPVAHPLLGATAHRVWEAAGVREGLLEQQVSLGWGIIALGLIAGFRWLVPVSRGGAASPVSPGGDVGQPVRLACVPVLVIVAVAALLCSLSPEGTIGRFTFVRPSALLYDRRADVPVRTRGSGSSCNSWRRCWQASAWITSAAPGRDARGSRV